MQARQLLSRSQAQPAAAPGQCKEAEKDVKKSDVSLPSDFFPQWNNYLCKEKFKAFKRELLDRIKNLEANTKTSPPAEYAAPPPGQGFKGKGQRDGDGKDGKYPKASHGANGR